MYWNDLTEDRPYDGQKVLAYDRSTYDFRVLVYDKACECWDDEDGHMVSDFSNYTAWIDPYGISFR